MTNVDRYQIIDRIGEGAMGAVYRANDRVLGRDVALKTLPAEAASDTELRERFYREAKIGARLRHPNIVTVYDLGQEQGVAYIAMELIEGLDLRRVIAGGAAMLFEEKLRIVASLAEGLAYSHSMGIVHRDIKPSNILIDRDGRPRISDFGVAHSPASSLTRTGSVLGTPHYMSPEQMSGEGCDERSDIFSLAVVAAELFTGKHPFDGLAVNHLIGAQSNPSFAAGFDLPPGILAVLRRALSGRPDARYASAIEFANALRSAAENGQRKSTLDELPLSETPVPRLGGTETILSAVLVNLQKFEEAVDRGDLSVARQAVASMRRAGAGDTRYVIALEQSSKRLAELESRTPTYVKDPPAIHEMPAAVEQHTESTMDTAAHNSALFHRGPFESAGLDATSLFEPARKSSSPPVKFAPREAPFSISAVSSPLNIPLATTVPPIRRPASETQPATGGPRRRQRRQRNGWPVGSIVAGLVMCSVLTMGVYFIKKDWKQEQKRLPAVATAEVVNLEAPLFASPDAGQHAVAIAHHGDVINILRAPRFEEQQWTEAQWISAGRATPAVFVRTADLGKWSSSDPTLDEALQRMFPASVHSPRETAIGEKPAGSRQR
jgi:serine/threonine protein kinase